MTNNNNNKKTDDKYAEYKKFFANLEGFTAYRIFKTMGIIAGSNKSFIALKNILNEVEEGEQKNDSK